MKKNFFISLFFIFTQTKLFAVFIGAGAHYPDGYYLINTLTSYKAEVLTDSKGKVINNDFDLSHTQLVTQGFYYTGNLVYLVTIPLERKELGLFESTKYGLGDSYLGIGYFLPINSINILPILQVKFPLGNFNKNDQNNIGTGTYSVHPELYINKMFPSFMLDASIEYTINFTNGETNIKMGNRLNLETVFAYIYSTDIMFGPSILYTHSKHQKLNGNSIHGTNTHNLFIGADILYSINKKTKLIFNLMKDTQSKNSPKGTTSSFLFIYSF